MLPTLFQTLVLAVILSFLSPGARGRTSQAAAYEKYRKIEKESPDTKNGLTAKEREILFQHVYRHPVVSLDHIDDYEPFPGDPSRAVGYCFGRAMAVHFFARSMGVKSKAIRKLYIIGDLRQKGATAREWGFHVTTLVQDASNTEKWYAIDPIMFTWTQGKSQTVQQWIDRVQNVWDSWHEDKNHHARLYLTSNSAVMPEARDDKNPIWDFENFDPSTENGFTAVTLGGEDTVYELDGDAQDRHFAGADEPGEDGFPFIGIWLVIDPRKGKEYFSFKNYFVKLLDSVLHGRIPNRLHSLDLSTGTIEPAKTGIRSGNRMHSSGMSFYLLPRQGEGK